MIEFKNVSKEYEQGLALNNLNLNIDEGELFVLVGPSGSGKTTLLKMINGLNTPTTGEIRIADEDIKNSNIRQLRHNIGYVLQAGALFPNMTVEQNASIQLDLLGWNETRKHDRICELMVRVGLDPETFLSRMPSELSGGEAQRVGIVRALAGQPNVVLMDEPFSALDPISRAQLQELVFELHREIETTFVFVTHDMQEALKLADRLAVLYQGELQQVGNPQDILSHPANQFVKDFFDNDTSVEIFLQQVIDAGFGVQQTDETAIPMGDDQTIFDWSREIHDRPNQLIVVDQIILQPEDLVNYMATLRVGVIR
ncbi:ATP-binding cassette domain-containing protein [Paucilactobacillus nenjiangensis]|uniref:ABC-type quaternary amine transporter n=1 Tax=Paucilactobacillus nenjiangensis TaxID=1296540 RepID=A0A5P1WZ19_9LACO|nr:ABC transporter ATP-binding protein [Paucilactobacillus nenjiangensis]QER66473.1 ABC transporter ATP-binding protein [Paucilactobacillus nenjiangensis]